MNSDVLNPLVTVIITTKNRVEPLLRAVESVKNQTYKEIEIIIVDDGSNHDIYQHTLSYNFNCEVKILRNEISKGACFARNMGIKSAKGSLIAGLDDDDEFTVQRISHLVKMYKKWGGKYSLYASHSKIVKLNECSVSEKKRKQEVTCFMMYKANFIGSQVLVDRDKLLDVGLFDESLVASQDHDMWLRVIEKFGNAYKVNEELYVCHDIPGQNRVSNKKLKGLIQFYKKHSCKMTFSERSYNLLRGIKMIITNPVAIKHLKDL